MHITFYKLHRYFKKAVDQESYELFISKHNKAKEKFKKRCISLTIKYVPNVNDVYNVGTENILLGFLLSDHIFGVNISKLSRIQLIFLMNVIDILPKYPKQSMYVGSPLSELAPVLGDEYFDFLLKLTSPGINILSYQGATELLNIYIGNLGKYNNHILEMITKKPGIGYYVCIDLCSSATMDFLHNHYSGMIKYTAGNNHSGYINTITLFDNMLPYLTDNEIQELLTKCADVSEILEEVIKRPELISNPINNFIMANLRDLKYDRITSESLVYISKYINRTNLIDYLFILLHTTKENLDIPVINTIFENITISSEELEITGFTCEKSDITGIVKLNANLNIEVFTHLVKKLGSILRTEEKKIKIPFCKHIEEDLIREMYILVSDEVFLRSWRLLELNLFISFGAIKAICKYYETMAYAIPFTVTEQLVVILSTHDNIDDFIDTIDAECEYPKKNITQIYSYLINMGILVYLVVRDAPELYFNLSIEKKHEILNRADPYLAFKVVSELGTPYGCSDIILRIVRAEVYSTKTTQYCTFLARNVDILVYTHEIFSILTKLDNEYCSLLVKELWEPDGFCHELLLIRRALVLGKGLNSKQQECIAKLKMCNNGDITTIINRYLG